MNASVKIKLHKGWLCKIHDIKITLKWQKYDSKNNSKIVLKIMSKILINILTDKIDNASDLVIH